MEQEKKKMGRPSQDKGWKSFSLDKGVIQYLDTFPDGERSKIVNEILLREISRQNADSERIIQ